MKKTVIGHVTCHFCPFPDAEVKEDKNGDAYIHCTDCNGQAFTRNAYRNTHLRKKMRPVTVTVTVTEKPEQPVPAVQPVTVTNTPQTAPRAPAPAQKAVPVGQVADKPKKSSWLQPLIGA